MTSSRDEQDQIDIVATFEAKPGRADALAAILQEAVTIARGEDGCRQYDLHSVRRQPDHFVIIERWATRDALKAHGAAPEFVEVTNRLTEELVSPPSIRVLEPVDVELAR